MVSLVFFYNGGKVSLFRCHAHKRAQVTTVQSDLTFFFNSMLAFADYVELRVFGCNGVECVEHTHKHVMLLRV